MKLTIQDGRDSFYTFDSNRILLLTATDEEQINQVEFSTEEAGGTDTWTVDVLEQEDGVKFVQVPNEFLNGDYTRLVCYAVALDSKGEFTRQKEVFRIKYRPQPEDWFLTYSERVTFASIKALTEQYKSNASDSAELASKYAENNEDVAVEPGKYSAKHWSIKSNKKYEEIRSYVGSASDPESALGSIESARANAVSDVEKQETDSIEAVGTYTSNTAIPSVSQYVEGTAKPALKTYGEQQVDSYVNGTSKPELDRYVNNEKKQVLDEYTAEKKTELDIYTSVDKKQVLDSYTENEKKTELDSHTVGLKEQLDAHTVAKAGDLNEHTTSLKGTLDGYTTAKEQDISEFTEQKKSEVQGVYQSDLNELKGDLSHVTKWCTSRNLFNKNSKNKKDGAYVNFSSGSIGEVDGYTATVIPIDATRENLTWSVKSSHIAFFSFVPNLSDYSLNQTIPNLIGGTATGNTIAIPINAKAVIISYPTNTEYVQVEYGTQQTIYQQYTEDLLINESKIENYANKVSFVTGKNLFNKNTLNKAIGYYANGENGNCGEVSSYSIVGIEVSDGDILSFNIGSLHVCALKDYTDLSHITSDKLVGEYISGFSDSTRKQGWIVPNGCKYITVSYPTVQADNLQIEKGTVSTDYEEYKKGIDGNIVFDKNTEVTVGESGCDYTSVLRALKETPPNITVHITSGTYNIEQEYKEYYGDDFWSNYDTYQGKSDMFYAGLWLAKGRKVYGDANTILDFSTYDGSNENVIANWSVIANSVDTELKNVTIKVNNNCRYSIHDDFEPMHGTITWERIIFDGQTKNVCIGAGIGVDVTYIIRDCIFNGNEYYNISYHGKNVDYATTPCKIYVTNCIGNSRIAFRWMGASTEITKCYVSGCKFGQYICEALNDQQPYKNMELIAWGNS